MDGILNAYKTIADNLVNKNIGHENLKVNIIGEKPMEVNQEINFNLIKEILANLEIKIKCRFLANTSVNGIKNLLRGSLNLLVYDDRHGLSVKKILEKRFATPFAHYLYPVGFDQTAKWLRDIARFYNKTVQADLIIEEKRELYLKQINRLRPSLEGIKIMIITHRHNIDWLIQPVFDLNMDIVKVCTYPLIFKNIFQSEFSDKLNIELNDDIKERKHDIEKLKPDLVIIWLFQAMLLLIYLLLPVMM